MSTSVTPLYFAASVTPLVMGEHYLSYHKIILSHLVLASDTMTEEVDGWHRKAIAAQIPIGWCCSEPVRRRNLLKASWQFRERSPLGVAFVGRRNFQSGLSSDMNN